MEKVIKTRNIAILIFLICILSFNRVEAANEHQSINIQGEIEKRILELQAEKQEICEKGTSGEEAEIDDRIYFLKKQLCAINTANLAQARYENAQSKKGVARYMGIYDSLSIASRIMVEFLPESEREKFFDWFIEAQQELDDISNELAFAPDQKTEESSPQVKFSLQEAKRELETLLQEAQKETLEDINSIEPDGFLHGVLIRAQKLQSELESNEPMNLDELENVVDLTIELMQAIKDRQLLKYNLWAEKLVRMVDIEKSYDANRAAYLYKNLGLIDLNLIYEPSLARVINERMYYLYEQLVSEKVKAKTRYEAIFLLEKRKKLNDF